MNTRQFDFFGSKKVGIAFIVFGVLAMAAFISLGVIGMNKASDMIDHSKSELPPDKDIFEGLVKLAERFNCTPTKYPSGSFYNTQYICTGENHYANEAKLDKKADQYLDDVYAPMKDKIKDARTLQTLSTFAITCFPLFVTPIGSLVLYFLVGMLVNFLVQCVRSSNTNRFRLFEDRASAAHVEGTENPVVSVEVQDPTTTAESTVTTDSDVVERSSDTVERSGLGVGSVGG